MPGIEGINMHNNFLEKVMSQGTPYQPFEFAGKINALNCDYLDAPVSDGEVGAKAASLTIMVGRPDTAFECVKPLFELMGKNIAQVGGDGDGQTCKVAKQIIVALNVAEVGEVMFFASKAGADPVKARQALIGGFAVSRILEAQGERMIKRTFAPGFRISLHKKSPEPGAGWCADSRPQLAANGKCCPINVCLRRQLHAEFGPFGAGVGAGIYGFALRRDQRLTSHISRHSKFPKLPANWQAGNSTAPHDTKPAFQFPKQETT